MTPFHFVNTANSLQFSKISSETKKFALFFGWTKTTHNWLTKSVSLVVTNFCRFSLAFETPESTTTKAKDLISFTPKSVRRKESFRKSDSLVRTKKNAFPRDPFSTQNKTRLTHNQKDTQNFRLKFRHKFPHENLWGMVRMLFEYVTFLSVKSFFENIFYFFGDFNLFLCVDVFFFLFINRNLFVSFFEGCVRLIIFLTFV